MALLKLGCVSEKDPLKVNLTESTKRKDVVSNRTSLQKMGESRVHNHQLPPATSSLRPYGHEKLSPYLLALALSGNLLNQPQ